MRHFFFFFSARFLLANGSFCPAEVALVNSEIAGLMLLSEGNAVLQ